MEDSRNLRNILDRPLSRRSFIKIVAGSAASTSAVCAGGSLWRRFLYEPASAFGYSPMSEAQNGLIYPTSITLGNEKIIVDDEISRSGHLPPQATYLQAALEEYANSPSAYQPQNISFHLAMQEAGTRGTNVKAKHIVHTLGLPVAKQIRRETFGLSTNEIKQRVMLGGSFGGFAFVRPAHLLGYTRTNPTENDFTLVGNAPLNRSTITEKEIKKLEDKYAAIKQKLGLFAAGLLSTRPYKIEEGEYRRKLLLNTTAEYLPPFEMEGYKEIYSTQDGTTNLNGILGYRGTAWEDAGIGDDIDPINRHGFELGLGNAVDTLFPHPFANTSLVLVAGVSYLDSSGASNTHPNLDPNRWYYNRGWTEEGCPIVTSLYSTPTPNLPIHFAFLHDLRNSEFIL